MCVFPKDSMWNKVNGWKHTELVNNETAFVSSIPLIRWFTYIYMPFFHILDNFQNVYLIITSISEPDDNNKILKAMYQDSS